MGLFGGFKAKFTRNSKPKQKSGEVVVPITFRIKPEFDSQKPPDLVPISLRPALRTTNSRYNRPVPRSQYFEETSRAIHLKLQSTSLTNLSKQPEVETKPTNEKTSTENEYDEPKSPPPIEKPKRNHVKEKRQAPVIEDEYYKSNSIYTPTIVTAEDDDYEEVTPSEDYKFMGDSSESTLILMTQNSDTSLASYAKTPPAKSEDYTPNGFATNRSNEFSFPQETEEDFKVNVVHHDLSLYVSEDELTQDEEEYQLRDESSSQYPRTSYSSQATNLFFGESEPVIARPRKLLLRNVDENEEDGDC